MKNYFKTFFYSAIIMTPNLVFSSPLDSGYQILVENIQKANTVERFEELDAKVAEAFQSISKLLKDKNYAKAIRESKKIRNKFRESLFENPRGNNSNEVVVNVKRKITPENAASAVTEYMGGNLIDLLNLYKRAEMYYTYAMYKRFLATGSSLRQSDIDLINKTFLEVIDMKITINSERSKNSITLYESNVVDSNENYFFVRELETYYEDLGVQFSLEDVQKNISLRKESELRSYCQKEILAEFKSSAKESVRSICSNPKLTYKNMQCLISEINKVQIEPSGKLTFDFGSNFEYVYTNSKWTYEMKEFFSSHAYPESHREKFYKEGYTDDYFDLRENVMTLFNQYGEEAALLSVVDYSFQEDIFNNCHIR